MATPEAPPVLSTPATHIFKDQPDVSVASKSSRRPDDQLFLIYEIERTLAEIKKEKHARIALQFPDHMLHDAPRVFEALSKGLSSSSLSFKEDQKQTTQSMSLDKSVDELNSSTNGSLGPRLYILADTSYGACCVDEIAAEHVNADVVVHYGRACLSPTARIPVIHIFTVQPLTQRAELIRDFKGYYGKELKIILMADVTHQGHLRSLIEDLRSYGFSKLYLAEIVHDPSSLLPNRTVPEEVRSDTSKMKDWHLLHISDPPESLLFTLASRLASIRIYPTSNAGSSSSAEPFLASTSRSLNRRYALLTSVSTVSIFGILINTLSVRNYLHIVEHIKSKIMAAGKKSYTFVVGKVNAAKVANFSEIGAWVVIGCWESSLIDSKDFWKPVLTPFELELALKGDNERIWTGEWSSDFQKILDEPVKPDSKTTTANGNEHTNGDNGVEEDYDSEPESAPPEFDLRTGRYVSNSRPMRPSAAFVRDDVPHGKHQSKSLIKRAKGDLAIVGGEVSPGAEHLRSKRTWKGLGSDFEIAYEESGSAIEEGRSGIARGYTIGVAEAKT